MCKSDLAMYKGVKEIFDGRFLSHKNNRNLSIWHTLSLTPIINLRFARPPMPVIIIIIQFNTCTQLLYIQQTFVSSGQAIGAPLGQGNA